MLDTSHTRRADGHDGRADKRVFPAWYVAANVPHRDVLVPDGNARRDFGLQLTHRVQLATGEILDLALAEREILLEGFRKPSPHPVDFVLADAKLGGPTIEFLRVAVHRLITPLDDVRDHTANRLFDLARILASVTVETAGGRPLDVGAHAILCVSRRVRPSSPA